MPAIRDDDEASCEGRSVGASNPGDGAPRVNELSYPTLVNGDTGSGCDVPSHGPNDFVVCERQAMPIRIG
jgi:hypothetical protein